MKNLTNKKAFKTISLMLVIIFITNVFMPIYSYADEDEETGGKLFKPIFKLFAGIGDLVMKGLQRIFIGNGDIKGEGISEIEQEGAFLIRYSPGVIFSGEVPGLNANFINPAEDKEATKAEIKWEKVEDNIKFDETTFAEKYGYSDNKITYTTTGTDAEWFQPLSGKEHAITTWTNEDGVSYKYIITNIDLKTKDWVQLGLDFLNPSDLNIISTVKVINIIFHKITDKEGTLYKNDPNGKIITVTKADGTTKMVKSTSKELQKSISKWYKALRLVALVGLLSVLVYVGIRIIISSTGQEKAKYKKMIMDWLAAICILFVLQYIMAFTMTIVENLINIFKTNVVGPNGEDILMTSIRQAIGDGKTYSEIFTDLILYLVLVIYTVVFTIHYLKRLVYLAFFTMIAPLIALTYPLDKIKDGQAQAFTMWLREYVFNALIPVIHILLYSIFVGSAIDFAQQNPLYAIVCIGFLIPAEKFIRKMFGFDKATTSSQIGAAASGAMVMNAVNKISHAAGNGGAGGKAGKPGKAGLAGGSGSGDGSPTRISDRPDGGSPLTDPADTKTPELTGGTNSSLGGDVTGTTKKPRRTIKGIGKGMSNIRKQYFNAANARKGVKALGRGARKAAIGALGAGALGTIGLAAGVASGDLGKAVQYAAGGAAGGFIGANKVGDKLTTLEKKNRDIFNEGSLGSTEFKTRETIKELQQDNDFNQLCKDLGINDRKDRKRLIREFSNNGITDAESIKKAVFAGSSSDMVKNNGQQGINTMIDAAKIRQQATKQGMNRKDVKELLNSRGITGPNEEEALNLIYSM